MNREQKVRQSLKISFKEGIFASVMVGLTEQYLAPFAIALHATVQQIGILAALPHLVASLFQLYASSWAYRFKSRRTFIVMGALVQTFSLLPLAYLPYLRFKSEIWIFIFWVIVFHTAGAMIGPVWGSLISDHIPTGERGRYFGGRNQKLGLVTVASNLAAGLILYFIHPSHPLVGFTVLCTMAALMRLISAGLLARMEDLPLRVGKEDVFTFWMFIRRFRESNFVKFVLFVSSMTFAVNIAAPFFAVYMLRDLHMNYFVYTILSLSAILTTLFSMKLWGEHADQVGNVKVLRLTSILLPVIPILWLFSGHPFYLVLVQIFSGFLWGGFNLAASNFIYDAVSSAKRIRCIAYFNVLNGSAISLGSLVGGYLASGIPPLFGFRLLSIFLLSGFLRFLVVIFLRPTFREVRPTRKVTSLDLFFSVVGVKPLLGSGRQDSASPFEAEASPR